MIEQGPAHGESAHADRPVTAGGRVSVYFSIRYLTPDAVCDYVAEQGLYR